MVAMAGHHPFEPGWRPRVLRLRHLQHVRPVYRGGLLPCRQRRPVADVLVFGVRGGLPGAPPRRHRFQPLRRQVRPPPGLHRLHPVDVAGHHLYGPAAHAGHAGPDRRGPHGVIAPDTGFQPRGRAPGRHHIRGRDRAPHGRLLRRLHLFLRELRSGAGFGPEPGGARVIQRAPDFRLGLADRLPVWRLPGAGQLLAAAVPPRDPGIPTAAQKRRQAAFYRAVPLASRASAGRRLRHDRHRGLQRPAVRDAGFPAHLHGLFARWRRSRPRISAS